MSDFFGQRFLDVLVLSKDEAGRFGRRFAGTGAILAAIFAQAQADNETPNPTVELLGALGISLDSVRLCIGIYDDPAPGENARSPFTDFAKQLVAMSVKECQAHGGDFVDVEHVVLALTCFGPEFGGIRALHRQGVHIGALREALEGVL